MTTFSVVHESRPEYEGFDWHVDAGDDSTSHLTEREALIRVAELRFEVECAAEEEALEALAEARDAEAEGLQAEIQDALDGLAGEDLETLRSVLATLRAGARG
jgi:hypothetical protein